MFDDNRTYSFNQYLFDIENFFTLNVECNIILPIHIWDDIFRVHRFEILAIISCNCNTSINFNKDTISKKTVLHIIKKDSNEYDSEFIVINDDILDKIRSYERNRIIDDLIN